MIYWKKKANPVMSIRNDKNMVKGALSDIRARVRITKR